MTPASPDQANWIDSLHRRIAELEELRTAIEEHRVDAFVVGPSEDKHVFVLECAERPYRMLIEEMRQGALTIDADGTILYCNRRYAEILGQKAEDVAATSLLQWILDTDRPSVAAALLCARAGQARVDARLRARSGVLPCTLSLVQLPARTGTEFGVIITDLSEQLAFNELAAAEEMARSILEQAGNAIILVDAQERILRGNAAAAALAGRAIEVGAPFGSLFDLQPGDRTTLAACWQAARDGSAVQGIEVRLRVPDRDLRHLLLSIGSLHDKADGSRGFVISLTDITERKALERALRAQTEELMRADQRKDGFLAMLSHELRGPLASVRNAAELLRQSEPSRSAVDLSCRVIDRQVGHMAGLLEELLDLSRIAHGKVLLRKETLDLAELVPTVAEDHRAAMAEAALGFEVVAPAGPVWVLADRTRVTQMLGNLLHNAAKFTGRGGRVRLLMEAAEAGVVVLQVEDTGIGIEADKVQRVFMPFEQVHPSRGGLGLGLALVKGLAELHGGTASVESDGPGKGSRFTLRLPMTASSVTSGAPVHHQDGHHKAGVSGGSSRILIIEDDRDSAEMLRMLFRLNGQRVAVADSGEEGLRQIKSFRPDVVLCDISLTGGISGHEVARRVRADTRLPQPRLVALSGHGSEEDLLQSREAGFDLHLVKPIDFAELQRSLEQCRPARHDEEIGAGE